MATKIKLMRLLQEIRGHAQITNRRPAPRPSALYLMQLRERAAQSHRSRRRLALATDFQESNDTPLPIKIHHIKTDESGMPMILL